MFYKFIKFLGNFVAKQFFRSVRFKGAASVEQGPLLVTANHPNVMIDGLLVACTYKRPLYFLAKSTLFKGLILSRILRAVHLVPIYRKQDNPNELSKNEETFKVATQTLSNREAIVIFPEGQSKSERRLQPFKTGAARIAFQAELEHDFKLNLKIQPVGITYSNFQNFQSSATVNIDQPIIVANYQELYQQDPMLAVRKLTEDIEQRIKEITVVVQEAELESLIEKISRLYETKDVSVDDEARFKYIAKHVETIAPKYPEAKMRIEKKIDEYIDLISVFNLRDVGTLSPNVNKFFILLSIPIVILGITFAWLPYKLTGSLGHALASTKGERASAKLICGLVIFPLWFLFLASALYLLGASLATSIIAFLIVISMVAFTNRYIKDVQLYLLSLFWPGRKNPLEVLGLIRDEILKELELFVEQDRGKKL